MSMIPIPQETFRSAMKAEQAHDRSRRAPLLILLTCVALWVGIWTAFAAAMGWL